MKRPAGFLTKISVTWKLNLIIAVLILGLLSVFISGIAGMQAIRSSLAISYNQILNSNTASNQLREALLRLQTNFEPLLNSNLSIDDERTYRDAMNAARQDVEIIIDNYETVHLTKNNSELSAIIQENDLLDLQEEEQDAFSVLQFSFVQYVIAETQFQSLRLNGVVNGHFAALTKSRLTETQQALGHLVDVNNQYSEAFGEESLASYGRALGLMRMALVIAIVVGWMLANAIARSIGSRLKYLEQSASSIEKGINDLRYTFTIEGSDEIAMLGHTFDLTYKKLQKTLAELEDRVEERTAELAATTQISEQRAQQFEAITLVGNAISSVRSFDILLPKITELISQQFGYYHVGIFLNDEINEHAVLRAANSEGGQRMLNRKHKLKIGEQGIVGYATSVGEPRIALDVGEDSIYFDNPDLPNTRSELALPLLIGEEILGALDVQSTEESAFSEEDISVLSILADQVSRVIENARLFEQARKSLSEADTLNRQFLRQAWSKLPREQNLGFRYDINSGASSIEANVQTPPSGKNKPIAALSIPIEIRGERIGTLSVQNPEAIELTNDQRDLVIAVAERVAVSAENARLLEDTSRRAGRERLVSEITTKIRQTNDPQVMIQTALNELKSVLGVKNIQVVPHEAAKPKGK